jgi:hypothetical protein
MPKPTITQPLPLRSCRDRPRPMGKWRLQLPALTHVINLAIPGTTRRECQGMSSPGGSRLGCATEPRASASGSAMILSHYLPIAVNP